MHKISESKPARWSRDELIEVLRSNGLKEGQTVAMFSSVGEFGMPDLKGQHLSQFYLDALFSILGETGVLAMSAFTYSFCSGKDFDPWKDRSTVNVIANYCIDEGIGVRTVDPIFSWVVVTMHDLRLHQQHRLAADAKAQAEGRKYRPFAPYLCLGHDLEQEQCEVSQSAACNAITDGVAAAPAQSEYYNIRQIRTTNDTLRYSAPSIVSYLLERNARYLMLGSIHYITFVHYLEHELRSSQRMFKQFTGKVMTRARGSWEHDGADFSCFYFVRQLCTNTEVNMGRFFLAICKWPHIWPQDDVNVRPRFAGRFLCLGPLKYMLDCMRREFAANELWYCNGPALTEEQIADMESSPWTFDNLEITTWQVIDLSDKRSAAD